MIPMRAEYKTSLSSIVSKYVVSVSIPVAHPWCYFRDSRFKDRTCDITLQTVEPLSLFLVLLRNTRNIFKAFEGRRFVNNKNFALKIYKLL